VSSFPSGNGDCFIVAADMMTFGHMLGDHYYMGDYPLDKRSNFHMVHAIVTGQGEIQGLDYEHAFIVDTKGSNDVNDHIVIDFSKGNEVVLPKVFYYALGNVREVGVYSSEETRGNLLKFKHFGPWYDKPERHDHFEACQCRDNISTELSLI